MVRYNTRTSSLKGKKLSTEEKIEVVEHFIKSQKTLRKYADQRELAYTTLNRWFHYYVDLMQTGVSKFHDKPGHPALYNEEAIETIIDNLVKAQEGQRTYTEAGFREMCYEVLSAAKAKENRAPAYYEPSKSTLGRLKRVIKVTKRAVQLKTPARVVAEADPRNAYTMYVMVQALCQDLDPNMIFNFDNTQYVIDKDASGRFVCVKTEKNGPLTAEGTGKLGLAVKSYHLHNANGYSSEMVIVIADDSMDENALKVHQITGFGNNNAIDSVGYLVFTKSRCGNKQFFRWYSNLIVIPFIEKCRQAKRCKVRM